MGGLGFCGLPFAVLSSYSCIRLLGFQRTVQTVGNRTLENGGGMTVQCFQPACGKARVQLSAHVEVHIQDEFDFLVLWRIGNIALDHAGSGVDLGPAGAVQPHLHFHGTFRGTALVHVLLRQRPQVRRGNQVAPGLALQLQRLPGENIHVPQADTLKKCRLIDADELGQRQVKVLAEFLPARVGNRAQGNKVPGKIQLPTAIGGDEMVVGNGFRRLQLCRRGPQAGDLGAGLVLAYGVADRKSVV